MQPTLLNTEQRASFERDGFLVVRNALSPEMLERLLGVTDRLYDEGVVSEGLSSRNHWQMRNCIVADPVLLELLDWPAIFPLVVGLLGWDIHLITSHLIVRPPSPPGTTENFKGEGWHRDGGQSPAEMQEPHPRLFLKVAYLLSDQSEPGRGNTQLLPGSNRLIGPPAQAEGAPHPYGAIEVLGKAGDAFLFEQRTWHAVGPNLSDITRKSLFFGYGFRWVRAMDYLAPPADLLPQCSAIRRQLLGEVRTPMGIYLPQDEDVPLRGWWQEHYGEGKS
ncbi:MAG: phytanoyl-CoA dioxygenase family protein [Armatimonadota bacterium]|nr:phytanoyl-CoA dioxygenase family protein [Armatimonadota bacterium]